MTASGHVETEPTQVVLMQATTIRAPILARREWDGVAVTISRIPPFMTPFPVVSRNVHHLVLLTSGSIQLVRADPRLDLRPSQVMRENEIYFTRAGTPEYELGWNGVQPQALRAIHVELDGSITSRLTEQCGDEAPPLEPVAGLFRDPLTEQLMRNLVQLVEHPDSADALFVDSATELLALQLTREQKRLCPPDRSLYRGLHPAKLRRVREYLAAHLTDDVRLEDLARESQLSTYHFLRAFKLATGMTPYAYLLQRRILRAKELLSGTRLSMAEVAKRSGFSSQAHLSKRFRVATGATPTAFRKQC